MTCPKCNAMMMIVQCEDFGILFDQYKCYKCGSVAYPDARRQTKQRKMILLKGDDSTTTKRRRNA